MLSLAHIHLNPYYAGLSLQRDLRSFHLVPSGSSSFHLYISLTSFLTTSNDCTVLNCIRSRLRGKDLPLIFRVLCSPACSTSNPALTQVIVAWVQFLRGWAVRTVMADRVWKVLWFGTPISASVRGIALGFETEKIEDRLDPPEMGRSIHKIMGASITILRPQPDTTIIKLSIATV